ncbi:hypothetical protein [Aquirufa ecclesiirivi]|uniref:hypothetical protein n=1 Tax=Aquirufa ecclesiirivi TaxID=2715124 RepID=UPI0023D8AC50|nr:hypothetical protein [Aquirufa ecclesiirivi]MDF0694775.1 hypothetical protein [Aquirufa ecclesiirivi]
MPNLIPPYDLFDEYISQSHSSKSFNSYNPSVIPIRKHETIEISTDNCVFRLVDKNQRDIVSFIELTKTNSTFWEIKRTKSNFTRKGFLSYLFKLLIIEFEYQILSDKIHTSPGSKEFWISLFNKNEYQIFLYNVNSNKKSKIKTLSEVEIWGIANDDLIEITRAGQYIYESYNNSNSTDTIDELEFEGFENIDLEVKNASITSNEIYNYVLRHSFKISSKENIRLLAQKK